jgi:hypothetical protein
MNHSEKYKYKYYKYLYKLKGGMEHNSPSKINISVRTMEGNTLFQLNIDDNTKLKTLKKIIFEKTGISINEHKLFLQPFTRPRHPSEGGDGEIIRVAPLCDENGKDQTLKSCGLKDRDSIIITRKFSDTMNVASGINRLPTSINEHIGVNSSHPQYDDSMSPGFYDRNTGETDTDYTRLLSRIQKRKRMKDLNMKMRTPLFLSRMKSQKKSKSKLTDKMLLDKSPHGGISNKIRGYFGDDYVSPQDTDDFREGVENIKQILNPINIIIRTLIPDHREIHMNVSSTITVEKLMVLIYERIGIRPTDQRLMLENGRQLEHGRTLTNYGIFNDSTIYLTTRLRSDKRLKYDINKIGVSKMGIPIYTFRYKQDYNGIVAHLLYEGVIAQDLINMGLDNTVYRDPDGFYKVDYSKIDVEFKKHDY